MKLRVSKKYIVIIMAIFVLTAAVYSIVNKRDETINIEDPTIPLGAQSIPARDAGMVPGDKSKASKNANLLIKALNKYGHVIIDDSYYIASPTETLTTRDVEITGMGNAELVADNNSSTRLFDTAQLSCFSLKNVSFVNDSGEYSLLIVYNSKEIYTKVEKVAVDSCTFTGNISLYRYYGDISLDPDIVDFGIENLLFNNNKVYNTKFSFIVLFDVPIKYCEISNNNVQNFMYNFLKITITNGVPFEKKLYENIVHLKVEGNNVICDDDWWGDTSGNYYTFILFEGSKVFYNNNHVEGMKALNDIALYDAYLSARVVNYTNNTWKNNICFASNKTNNTLLKAKGGGDSLVRNFEGNVFVVDENFATRVGQSKDNLYVDFMSLTKHADSYTVTNNTFDIYDLRFPASSLFISNLHFINNTIKAKKASGNLAIVRLNDEFPTDSIDIRDNIIEIEALSTIPINLIKVVDDRKDSVEQIGKVSVTGNQIKAPISYIFYKVIADDLVFTDNKINDVSEKFSNFAYKGSFNLSESSGNSIEPEDAFSYDDGRRVFGMNTENGGIYEQGQ